MPYMASSRGKAESQVITLEFVTDKNVDCHTYHFNWPRKLYNFTAEERALAGPTLAPPFDMGCWGGTIQHPGRNVPELGAERPRLWRTWGGSTRGGSTEGRIDRYPKIGPD